MKKTILLLFFLSQMLGVHAQSAKIQALEDQLRPAFGPGRVSLYIALSDACIEEGQFDKAADWAEEGADFARKIKQSDLRAVALNRQGKAMMLGGKRKAAGRFEASLDILRENGNTNKTLVLDNLHNLRRLSERSGKAKDIALIDDQIAVLEGRAPGASSDVPVTKSELRNELAALQQQLANAGDGFKTDQVKMMQESKELQAQLAAKEAAMEQMSEEQMKSSMLLMQQRLMLDSLVFRAGIDSLEKSNAKLALSEANSSRKFYIAAMVALLLLAGGSLFSFVRARTHAKVLEEKNKIIREEQQRSENLLLNILPSLVAEELKKKGHTNARLFEDVSVLFADFVGFSKIAELLGPQELVSELDTCFRAFDQIIANYNLEKIKTIGDCYMCAGGLPNGGGAQLSDMVRAARDMQKWLHIYNTERIKTGKPRFEARIGIHRGPVVAGVVGSKKFAFDIWGDTVNIAARIEQAGEGGKINISGEAYELIRDSFPCTYRGKIAAKNKGEIDMYFVDN
ncbi:MAG TPA: adenylate/guanylate cyclase domain-containing protein [Saprospiraceae bacterium]|nr:adenylate/guanylate cyclase domain-containing protein [Saprospiraceae bacterium]HPI08627.1 adenylate/guanylate cyclase domain-containing protein [Saprospiraceae bacterium]